MMNEIITVIIHTAQAKSSWELVGVLLNFAYLFLIIRQNIFGWYAAFGGTAIFSWLFWDASLLMESGLNIYYLIMAVYGWWVWKGNERAGKVGGAVEVKPIQAWSLSRHALVIGSVILASLITGYGLEKNTSAALPYLDSFTTWGAVITTYMVAQKVLENWLYWLVIDTVAIYLYVDRELYLIALQTVVYIVMIFFGWFIWLKEYRQQNTLAGNAASA